MPRRSLGELIDSVYRARERRLVFQRKTDAKIKELREKEEALTAEIFERFDADDIEQARGGIAVAARTKLVVPSVRDWPAVFGFITRTGAWDLMEKRMARVAYRDRLDAGEEIPGVEPFTKTDLSLTKIGE